MASNWGEISNNENSSNMPSSSTNLEEEVNKFFTEFETAPKKIKLKKPQKHWGEIPREENEDFIPDVNEDIEKAMKDFCIDDFDDDSVPKEEHLPLSPMDPLMLYSMSLHKYINEMYDYIDVVANNQSEDRLIPALDEIPSIPPMPEIELKHKRNCLNFIPKDFTPFSRGEEVEVPEFSEFIVKKLLVKSIATMLGHIGYEKVWKSSLDVLEDVLDTFYKKICAQLKTAVEDDENQGGNGFPNAVERVLTETGMGGVKGLHDYYQSRVVKYIAVLQKRCQNVKEQYINLIQPKCPSPHTTSGGIKVKIEEEDEVMDTDNPEVHLHTIDGEVGSILEPGYQLLNSLEAEANLQNITETDEDVVSSSPGIISISSEGEIPQLSAFSKKKRIK